MAPLDWEPEEDEQNDNLTAWKALQGFVLACVVGVALALVVWAISQGAKQ